MAPPGAFGPHPALSQSWERVHLSWDWRPSSDWRSYWNNAKVPWNLNVLSQKLLSASWNLNVLGGKLLSPRFGREDGSEGRWAGSPSRCESQLARSCRHPLRLVV